MVVAHDTALDAALEYAECGLSVLPLRPRSKAPLGSWTAQQKHVEAPDAIRGWYAVHPSAGVGVVAGAVSVAPAKAAAVWGLAVLDVDDAGFAAWLQTAGATVLERTWTVRTGSGKLHVYVYSATPCYSHKLNPTVGDGGHLADVRAGGSGTAGPSYVAAPPTVHPDSGQQYTTLHGGPGQIATVNDATAFFALLRERYEATLAAEMPAVAAPTGMDSSFRPALTGDDLALYRERLNLLNITGKIKRAILNGAKPGEGEWASVKIDSDSEIDYAVIAALHEEGCTADEIENYFASYPIGDLSYRDTARPHHGSSYFRQTFGSYIKTAEARELASRQTLGTNFRILAVRKFPYTEVVYELDVLGQSRDIRTTVRYTYTELMSEGPFWKRLATAIDDQPLIDSAYRGKGFGQMVGVLLRMSVTQELPDTATTAGQLAEEVLHLLRGGDLVEGSPTSAEDFRLGWIEPGGKRLYVRPGIMVRSLQARIQPRPTPEQVWEVMRSLGGEAGGITWPDQRREPLWALPARLAD